MSTISFWQFDVMRQTALADLVASASWPLESRGAAIVTGDRM